MSNLSGTGRTRLQIQRAPQGAIYVWCNHRLHYPAALAKALHREDLEIVSRAWLDNDHWRNTRKPIVIDHGCYAAMNVAQLGVVCDIGERNPQ